MCETDYQAKKDGFLQGTCICVSVCVFYSIFFCGEVRIGKCLVCTVVITMAPLFAKKNWQIHCLKFKFVCPISISYLSLSSWPAPTLTLICPVVASTPNSPLPLPPRTRYLKGEEICIKNTFYRRFRYVEYFILLSQAPPNRHAAKHPLYL